MKFLLAFLTVIILCSCSSSSRYEVTDDFVIYNSPWGTRKVQGADTTSFQPLSEAFARDNKNVYFGEEVVVGANPATFDVLDFHTGRDAHSIFRASSRCVECDYASFQKIDNDWYLDKNAAYSAMNNGWSRIEGVDTLSFVVLNDWFAKDKNYVYLNSSRIPGADPASFKLGNCGASEVSGEDKNRCYWYDQAVPCDCKPHAGIEFPSFLAKMAPGKARISSVNVFNNPVHIVSVDGVHEPHSLNVELPAGNHVLGLECPDIEGGATGTASLTVKDGRLYNLKPHDGKSCRAELEDYAVVRGSRISPQIRINNLPYKPGRDVQENGLYEVRLPPGQHMLSVTCIDVHRDGVREASTTVKLDAKSKFFYELAAQFKDNVCDARVVVNEKL